MNTTLKSLVAGLSLIAGLNAAAVEPPQVETEHSCCLAAEWQAVEYSIPAQTDGEFCCLASEWQAPGDEPAPRLPAAQSDELSCCLASEWQLL